jgi:predicted dienelactone hydrolase
MRLLGILLLLALPAWAGQVGETNRIATEPTAILRDAQHRDTVRVTVWYPASPASVERKIVIGPPLAPYFEVGSAAPNAPFALDGGRYPVILLSHGFGSSARMIGWLGIALARNGYIVVAVDHPGNNSVDEKTIPGALLWWERTEDLRAALAAIARDPAIGPHMNLLRIGAAGFSAGGFTVLAAAGARADRDAVFARPEIASELKHASDDHSLPEVRAVFAIAPALVRALDPASLARMRIPVAIMLGDKDTVAPPVSNGLAAARAIPNAQLSRLPNVGHYDFLASCTPAGRLVFPQCRIDAPQADTHAIAVEAAIRFFGSALKP